MIVDNSETGQRDHPTMVDIKNEDGVVALTYSILANDLRDFSACHEVRHGGYPRRLGSCPANLLRRCLRVNPVVSFPNQSRAEAKR